MKPGLLLLTHPGVGAALTHTAETILGDLPLAIEYLAPSTHEAIETTHGRAEMLINALDSGAGVIILTDAYGATPSNMAVALGRAHRLPVLAGLNLPMLLRILNYPDLSTSALVEKALSAAQDGILQAVDPDE